MLFGIDISRWQKGIDLEQAKKEGVQFVIIKASQENFADPCVKEHYKKAWNAGLKIGFYHYCKATNENESRKEAKVCYNIIKEFAFELPVFLDIEDKKQQELSKEQNTKIVLAFYDKMQSYGIKCGVYASKSFFENKLNDNELKHIPHWVAQWSKKCTYKGDYVAWQFGGEINELRKNTVAGMVCDQDYLYDDFCDDIRIKIDGVNRIRKNQEVILYSGTKTGKTGTNKWGFEVAFNKNGVAICKPIYGVGNMEIPKGGFVISGHDKAGEKIAQTIKKGSKITLQFLA